MRDRHAGFTLIEVLVAVVIIGFVLLAVTPMFLLASRSNAAGADLGACGALAMERMELLRIEDFDALAPGGNLGADVSGYSDTSHPGYVVRWRITAATEPAAARVIAVRALAERRTIGLQKSATLTTLRVP